MASSASRRRWLARVGMVLPGLLRDRPPKRRSDNIDQLADLNDADGRRFSPPIIGLLVEGHKPQAEAE